MSPNQIRQQNKFKLIKNQFQVMENENFVPTIATTTTTNDVTGLMIDCFVMMVVNLRLSIFS